MANCFEFCIDGVCLQRCSGNYSYNYKKTYDRHSMNNWNKCPDNCKSVSDPSQTYGGYTHGPYSQKWGDQTPSSKVGGARLDPTKCIPFDRVHQTEQLLSGHLMAIYYGTDPCFANSAPLAQCAAQCPVGWEFVSGKCYQVIFEYHFRFVNSKAFTEVYSCCQLEHIKCELQGIMLNVPPTKAVQCTARKGLSLFW
ncbi:hypothetical protein WR25_25445 [Diploscapter pachys]|uniref:Uncharacterized protein n=1 Tax=Diploscapter pachys TaxID=2018661 RepID=A0A2A2J2X2_9BILA|nr:hypothetical protein WR25_25445 [Diploscapter pachys]